MTNAIELITTRAAQALDWWISELWSLAPKTVGDASRPTPRRLFVSESPEAVCISLADQNGDKLISQSPPEGNALHSALANAADADPSIRHEPIWFKLSEADYLDFARTRPAQARAHLEDLARLDFERSVPLSSDEVLLAIETGAMESGELAVTEYAVKRKRIDQIIAHFEASSVPLAGITIANTNTDFLRSRNSAGAAPSRHALTLVVAALVCLSMLWGGLWFRQERTINLLEEKTAAAEASARDARRWETDLQRAARAYQELSALRHAQISVSEQWEALSLAIPNGAWLTRLDITGDGLEMTGQAQNAAPLVPALEASTRFQNARLAAPISLDVQSGKERFSIAIDHNRAPNAASGPQR